MKHRPQSDNTETRLRPRSGVIKASKQADLHDAERRRQYESREVSKSNARRAIDRASCSLKESPPNTNVQLADMARESGTSDHREDAPTRQRVNRQARQVVYKPATEPVDVAGNTNTAKWYQLKWVKYGFMSLAVALMIAVAFLKPIDNSSESQIDSALTRALVGFGIARTLNGVISVAQGTEFAVQPAGVGVNFSPGEILDPVNDLIERFSWVMLVATSSLGVQKILLEVSSWIGISIMLAGAAVFWLLTRLQTGSASSIAKFASRVLLVMLVLRFLIPIGSIANDWVYRQFLQPQFETSSQQLEVASERIREISTRQSSAPEESNSLRQKAKNIYQSMTSKFDFDGMLQDYKKSAEDVSEHAVNLIVVFFLQTILFPMIFLFVVYRAFRYLLLPTSNA